jgi:membrane protease YdiL (CAAX protease family)
VAAVAAGVLLALWSHLYDLWQLPPRLPGTFGLMLGGDVLPMLVAPALFVRVGLGEPLARYGWRWPGARKLLGGALLGWAALLPLVVPLSRLPELQAFYPSTAFPPAREHAIGLAFLWILHHAPQLLAVECCQRGLVLLPLARRLGIGRALVAAGAFYVVLHAGKPAAELLLAALGAVVFGLLAWRTGSFLPPFLAHWGVAVTMDALCFASRS